MNSEEKDIEELEEYINKTLSADKSIEVEKRLTLDSEFKNLYERLSLLKETAQRALTRQKIKDIQAKKLTEWNQADHKHFPTRKVNWLKYAAIPLAACLIAILYFGNADFASPDMATLTERGNIGASADANYIKYQQAHQALKNQDYQVAATYFSELKEEANLRKYYQDAARWYEVVATMQTDKKKAKELLTKIDKIQSLYPTSELEWWKMKIQMAF